MATKKIEAFDPAKLQTMQEPLTVRVEKIKGNLRTPIDIPGRDDHPPGCGLTREDVQRLETFIRDEWTGGGYYRGTVTDVNGVSMSWSFGWDPRTVPERNPPTMGTFMGPPPAPPAPQPQASSSSSYSGGGSGWPPHPGSYVTHFGATSPLPATPTTPTFAGAGHGHTPYAPWQFPGASWFSGPPTPPSWGFSGGPAANRDHALEERLAQLEREKLQAEHRAEMDRLAQQHARQMEALQNELRRLADDDRRKPQESEETKLLRERLAQMEAQQREERLRYERERDREEMQRRVEQLQQELHRQTTELLAKLNDGKPDALLTYLREATREQTEAQKELARMQQAQMDKLATFMMNPMELTRFLKEQSSSAEHVLKPAIESFKQMQDLQRAFTENLLQLQGGGSPAENIIQGLAERASAVAEQFLRMRRDTGIAAAKARAAELQAMAAQQQQQQQQAQVYQLHGAEGTVPPNGQSGPAQPVNHSNPQTTATAPEPQAEARAAASPIKNPTEADMFGPVLPHIQQLREHVYRGEVSPEQAVDYILTGVNEVTKANLVLPAFQLFEQERYEDFIDVILPKASTEFQSEAARIMREEVSPSGEVLDEDEDDGSSDDARAANGAR